jgi:outer membrane lipoprotein-sorting protein
MEERYRKMSKMGVRNIDGYNGRVEDALSKGEMFSRTVQTGFDDETGEPVFETEEFAPEKMPYIVVIVDEMADLMMVAGKEIEACIQRLAQMARASGIHLIMATQRPSVDVITGTIKANFPTRISFQVTSKVDSRTILGEMGAEQLLGMGDMLYMAGGGKITRCHGPFVSDEEVEEVVNHLKAFGPPDYVGGVQDGPDDEEKVSSIDAVLGLGGNTDGEDALYDQAVQIAIKDRKCSTSYIQRKLAIGYNKAARLVEQMEEEGVVSAANHVGKREILVPEHLNGLKTAQATFTQIAEDGTLDTGTLWLNRPGRMRFEYDPPNGATVVARAGAVVISDPRSNQPPETYPLNRTPLSIILARRVDLGRANMVVGHAFDGTATIVTAQDPENPEYGRIELSFTDDPVELRKWVVTDSGGGQTTVILGALEAGGAQPDGLYINPTDTHDR